MKTKIEIELDTSQIDYDSINKQIAEKVAAIKIEEWIDIESVAYDKLRDTIDDLIKHTYSPYLEDYGYGTYPNAEGKNLINQIMKNQLEKIANETYSKIIKENDIEKEMYEVMLKFMPHIFVSILAERIRGDISSYEYNQTETTLQIARNEMENRINQIRYNL